METFKIVVWSGIGTLILSIILLVISIATDEEIILIFSLVLLFASIIALIVGFVKLHEKGISLFSSSSSPYQNQNFQDWMRGQGYKGGNFQNYNYGGYGDLIQRNQIPIRNPQENLYGNQQSFNPQQQDYFYP